MVKPVCESRSAVSDLLLQIESEISALTVYAVAVCGCWVSGNGGSEESQQIKGKQIISNVTGNN